MSIAEAARDSTPVDDWATGRSTISRASASIASASRPRSRGASVSWTCASTAAAP
jgi:hypothetical protein